MIVRVASFASAVCIAALIAAGYSLPASAETVELAPGVQVTKRTFKAPVNEQPFFGFVEKTDAQRAADEKFVKDLVQAAGSREKALDEVTKRGWRALATGKYNEAALRFNQAYLVAPEQSVVYHGLAVIAQIRFNDLDFAEELFRIAGKQPNPLKVLNADYGRVLVAARKPKQAQPVLEQAVKDTPDFGDARCVGQSSPRPPAEWRPRCRLCGCQRGDETAAVFQRGGRSRQVEK
jgi:hypothetical protein